MEHVKEGGSQTLNAPAFAEALTNGFEPQYVFAPRLAGRLACGELAIEPVLGPVRVMDVNHQQADDDGTDHAFVQVTWRDEQEPGTATGRYPADRSFEVRMPDLADRLTIRRRIDQAMWLGREITDDTARLIAAHLHPGEQSALHAFTVDGGIDEQLYDELEMAAQHRFYAQEWVGALTRYCLARANTGPIEAWVVRTRAYAEAEARAELWLSEAGVSIDALHEYAKVNGNGNGSGADRRTRHGDLLNRKYIKTETAAQLIDAAFLLGVATRKRARRAVIEKWLGEPITVPAGRETA